MAFTRIPQFEKSLFADPVVEPMRGKTINPIIGMEEDNLFDDDERRKLEAQNFTPEQIKFLPSFLKERGFNKSASVTAPVVIQSQPDPVAQALGQRAVDSLEKTNTPRNQAENLIAQRLATAPLARNRAEYDRKVRTIREETYLDLGVEDPLKPKKKGVYTSAELRRMGANDIGFDWGNTDDPLRGRRL